MYSVHRRRYAACFVFLAVTSAALVGCSGGESNGLSTSTSPSPTSPTEKSINPTGGNLFTPPVKAPGPQAPAPGNLPGNEPKN